MQIRAFERYIPLTHSNGAFILLINLKMATIVEGKFLWYKSHRSFGTITVYSNYVKDSKSCTNPA